MSHAGKTPLHVRTVVAGAAILGFALGGFFDGILLHQVLQWHHFLSLARGAQYTDIRVQILADGLFHVAVYVVTAVALWLLWRRGQARPGDRILLAWAAIGFGIWQFSDVVIFHWIIGIHNIRVGVPNPILWDIGWLIVFGLPGLALGLWLLRRDGGGTHAASRNVIGTKVLSIVAVVAAPVSALPPSDAATLVVFRPGVTPAQALSLAASVDARVLWSDPSAQVLALEMPKGSTWPLYKGGALFVSTSGLAPACLAWTRV